jgi:Domain of Unknown Function (DUF1080)
VRNAENAENVEDERRKSGRETGRRHGVWAERTRRAAAGVRSRRGCPEERLGPTLKRENPVKRTVRGAHFLIACGSVAAACIGACSSNGGNSAFDLDAGTSPANDAATNVTPGSDGGSEKDASAPLGSDAGSDSGEAESADAASDANVGEDGATDASAGDDAAIDASTDDARTDAPGADDGDAGTDAGDERDTGSDTGAVADTGVGTDAESPADASADASDAASGDASSTTAFGTSCPAGAVFSDAFTTNPLTAGTWTSIAGPVTYDGTNDLLSLATGAPNTQAWVGARPAWTDYTISVQLRIDTTGGNGGINFRMTNPAAGNDSGQMYYAALLPTGVQLGKENNGWTQLDLVTATFATGTFYTMTVTANGSALSVTVNGTTYITSTDSTFTTGSVGLRSYLSGMSYKELSVTCNP